MSVEQAHRILHVKLNTSLDEEQGKAKQRLLHAYKKSDWRSDRMLLLRHFDGLDVLLFNGTLRDRVCVQWVKHGVLSPKTVASTCIASGNMKIRIRLDQKLAWFSLGQRRDFVWGTLVHEMLHAYLFLRTGTTASTPQNHYEVCHCACRVSHGPLWRATVLTLAARLQLPGLVASSIEHNLHDCHRWNNELEQERNEHRLVASTCACKLCRTYQAGDWLKGDVSFGDSATKTFSDRELQALFTRVSEDI